MKTTIIGAESITTIAAVVADNTTMVSEMRPICIVSVNILIWNYIILKYTIEIWCVTNNL